MQQLLVKLKKLFQSGLSEKSQKIVKLHCMQSLENKTGPQIIRAQFEKSCGEDRSPLQQGNATFILWTVILSDVTYKYRAHLPAKVNVKAVQTQQQRPCPHGAYILVGVSPGWLAHHYTFVKVQT